MDKIETYISVDIETSGPIPGEYSLMSIGACLVYRPEVTFECLLKPITMNADPEALKVTGMSLDFLQKNGVDATFAITKFGKWLEENVPSGTTPVFVGFNAAFDWSFINYYFHKFCGANPFGFAALDIKSLYMGAVGSNWFDTKSSHMISALAPSLRGTHNALEDAKFQAELFRLTAKLYSRSIS